MMAPVNPLVPEIPANRVNLIVASHNQALEVKLVRDGQIHLATQRVHVRLKRLGRPPAVLRLNHWRVKLQKSARVEKGADSGDHLADLYESLVRFAVQHRVEITLPQHQLPVLQPRPLVRQRTDSLGQQAQVLNQHRDFASFGLHHFPGRLDEIA